MAHALLSASSAERWLHCPPSVRLTEDKKDAGSVYAAEGTLAHNLAEDLLREALGGPKAVLPTKDPLYYSGMVDDVQPYVDYVLETYRGAGPGASIDLEQRLDFSKYVPGGFGTGDCIIISGGTLEIIDLKFGKGVEVNATQNPQLMLYGLGAFLAYDYIYDIHTVRMTIVQPRRDHIDTYELSASMLIEWATEIVAPTAQLAYEGKGELAAGEWCRWCKIKSTCRHRAQDALNTHKKYSGKELSPAEIGEVLAKADGLKEWVKDVQEHALSLLLAGTDVPGWKAVEGRSNRVINNPEALANGLRSAGYTDDVIYKPQELQTLTALEKLVGKKKFTLEYGQCLIKPAGKPTLAPESDKRPALNSVENEFDFEER